MHRITPWLGTRSKSCRSCLSCSNPGYGAVSYGTVGLSGREAGVSSMDRKISRPAADVIETRPITLAGVETHPGWHALRTLARRITTPLFPDDYLRLANPLWSARELRGRIL